jgi:sec-independent protein translocase protein TatC
MSTHAGAIQRPLPEFSWRTRAAQTKAALFQTMVLAGAALSEMPFLDHLEELRSRLLKSLIAIAIGTAVCLSYSAQLIRLLGGPAAVAGIHLVPIEATEIFSLYFKVGLAGGICLAAPVILWQIWRFIEPALYPREKRYAAPFLISTTICFIGGAVFGYTIVLPWFLVVQKAMAEAAGLAPVMGALSYFGLLTMTALSLGAIFEMPPVVLILSRIGLLNARVLLRNFKYAFVIFSIAAAVLTPTTTDVAPMLAFMAVMTAVYGVSIVVALVFGRTRKPE